MRVGIDGIEVVQPIEREFQELETFLKNNQDWVFNELDRVEHFRSIRKPFPRSKGEILFRGIPTPVHVENVARRKRTNKIVFANSSLTIVRGIKSQRHLQKLLKIGCANRPGKKSIVI